MARILYAEDDIDGREDCIPALKKSGHEFVVATNGIEAIEALRTQGNFDVLLTDYKMPGADGIDVIEVAKALAQCPRVIILYTNSMVGRVADVLMVNDRVIPSGVIAIDKSREMSDVIAKINEEL